jgi:hypothetical protein
VTSSEPQSEYEAAVRARDRLVARVTFWERYRALCMVPLILCGAALGYGVGYVLRVLAHFPEKSEFYAAVIGIVIVGRVVTSFFDVRKLDAARVRVDMLARKRNSKPRQS